FSRDWSSDVCSSDLVPHTTPILQPASATSSRPRAPVRPRRPRGRTRDRSAGMSPDRRDATRATAYWRRNLRYLAVLLSIWFLVSYGAGILFAAPLNAVRIPG